MDSSQNRNLPASQRKLQKARDDGQVARSRDLSNLAVLGAGAAALVALAPTILDKLKQSVAQSLTFDARSVTHAADAVTRLHDATLTGMGVSAVFAAITLPAVIVGAVATGGWVFSLAPLSPDFNRVNPLAGIGRLFSKEQFTSVLKLIALTAVLFAVGYSYFVANLEQIVRLSLQPSVAALPHLARWITGGMAVMLLVVFVIAALDVPLQSVLYKARMRMSYEEVKKEHKEAEGNPLMKGKLRSRQREIAQRHSVKAVPKADFVVMNPTHFAVALKYDEARMAAPQVISKGADLLALRIRDLAKQHQIPVLQAPMLARALYAHAEINQEIPAKLYTAVAQVLAYVYRLKTALKGDGPMPEQLAQPLVPAELDPFNAEQKGTAA